MRNTSSRLFTIMCIIGLLTSPALSTVGSLKNCVTGTTTGITLGSANTALTNSGSFGYQWSITIASYSSVTAASTSPYNECYYEHLYGL